ncbi:hypothetical protein DFAR_1260040 [Desulfarculales bacterium]
MPRFTFPRAQPRIYRPLRQALLKRGLPRKLYLDNGPAFRSNHLNEITAIALIH